MVTRRPTQVSDTFDDTLVDHAEQRVREAGAVLTSKLLPKDLSRTGQAAFLEALARRGLERTGTRVRVPIDEQLLSRLRSEGTLPMAGLQKRIAGATGTEAKRSVARLVSSSAAVLLVRDKKELLSVPSPEALSLQALDALRGCVKQLEAMVRSVKPKKGAPPHTLHQHDVDRVLAGISRSEGRHDNNAAEPSRLVLDAIARMADSTTGLTRVPDLVRSLQPAMGVAEVRATLLSLQSDGRIELRPESGVGLLSAEDAALCPRGIRDTVLSFVRPLPPAVR